MFRCKKAKVAGGTVTAVAVVGSAFMFGERSNRNLATLCPAPQQLAHCMIQETDVDFMVIEGYRSQERQNKLYAKGRTEKGQKVTWTLNSRHTSGLAFDIVALQDGEIDWSPDPYHKINESAEKCSAKLGIDYVWGGNFKGRDYGHFETKACIVEKTQVDV